MRKIAKRKGVRKRKKKIKTAAKEEKRLMTWKDKKKKKQARDFFPPLKSYFFKANNLNVLTGNFMTAFQIFLRCITLW